MHVSATIRSIKVRGNRFTVVVHVRIWFKRVVAGERHSVLAKKLTPGSVWVCLDALLRFLVVAVEELDLVDVFRRPLVCVDVIVAKKTSGLP